MAFRTTILILFLIALLGAEDKVEFVCPMDRDVRQATPGKCPKCGMKLVAGLPDPEEYQESLKVDGTGLLTFRLFEPRTNQAVTRFEVVHEKLFHLFLVSSDLRYFAHEHPVVHADGSFTYQTHLPGGGEYRVLSDLYPAGGTPQLIAKTIFVPGDPVPAPSLTAPNLRATLTTEPAKAIAGFKTMLFFKLDPSEGLEPYLGVWGHMLAASADLIDMIHTHPAWDDPKKPIQFNVIFPRPGNYRVWVQFQRLGQVNTFSFDVPVSALE